MSDHEVNTTNEMRLSRDRLVEYLEKKRKFVAKKAAAPAKKPLSFLSRLFAFFTSMGAGLLIGGFAVAILLVAAVRACSKEEPFNTSLTAIHAIETVAVGQPPWVQRLAERMKNEIRRNQR